MASKAEVRLYRCLCTYTCISIYVSCLIVTSGSEEKNNKRVRNLSTHSRQQSVGAGSMKEVIKHQSIKHQSMIIQKGFGYPAPGRQNFTGTRYLHRLLLSLSRFPSSPQKLCLQSSFSHSHLQVFLQHLPLLAAEGFCHIYPSWGPEEGFAAPDVCPPYLVNCHWAVIGILTSNLSLGNHRRVPTKAIYSNVTT